jgi:hypothetical protein
MKFCNNTKIFQTFFRLTENFDVLAKLFFLVTKVKAPNLFNFLAPLARQNKLERFLSTNFLYILTLL